MRVAKAFGESWSTVGGCEASQLECCKMEDLRRKRSQNSETYPKSLTVTVEAKERTVYNWAPRTVSLTDFAQCIQSNLAFLC